VSIKIVDDKGQVLPANTSGEICIGGAMNFSEYWNRPEDTSETLVDGWVVTGDIGYLDDEGFVFITDRQKDMIIRGGENIGCQEVEATIHEHPKVLECAVFGLPDERLGETVAAAITAKPETTLTAKEIQEHVAQRLAKYKSPAHVWIYSEQLPRIASGKIYKRGLREDALLKLQEQNKLSEPRS
jgi:acyl-CoA synthetase (AMP-forming)/AMP-acid ligase II